MLNDTDPSELRDWIKLELEQRKEAVAELANEAWFDRDVIDRDEALGVDIEALERLLSLVSRTINEEENQLLRSVVARRVHELRMAIAAKNEEEKYDAFLISEVPILRVELDQLVALQNKLFRRSA